MLGHQFIVDLSLFLVAYLFVVPLFRRLGFGSSFGFLLAGLIFGPGLVDLVRYSDHIKQISEIGIIFLLFAIGLDFPLAKMKEWRLKTFEMGLYQFILTNLFLYPLCLTFSSNAADAFLFSIALSFSSTAFGLYYLKEERQLGTEIGQKSFRILILQDMLAIPVLALIPLFGNLGNSTDMTANKFVMYLMCMAFQLGFCLKIYPKLSAFIKKRFGATRYFSFVLLFVLVNSLLTELYGLSTAFGAFFSGAFLANSDDRGKILKFTIPLKTMLMGVFFLAVGLSVDIGFIRNNLPSVMALTVAFLGIKFAVFLFLGIKDFGKKKIALRLPFILATGSEFGLMVIMSADNISLLSMYDSQLFTAVLSLSLLTAPLFNMIDAKFFHPKNDAQGEVHHLPTTLSKNYHESKDEKKAA